MNQRNKRQRLYLGEIMKHTKWKFLWWGEFKDAHKRKEYQSHCRPLIETNDGRILILGKLGILSHPVITTTKRR